MQRRTLLAAALLCTAVPAGAAQRSFSVTSFDRIRVDGPYSVRLSTGVAPYARATGSSRALDSISVRVEGRTLTIRRDPSAWGGLVPPSSGPAPHDASLIVTVTAQPVHGTLSGTGVVVLNKAIVVATRLGEGKSS